MKEINFRIVELPDYQVLLAKDYDSDEEKPLLVVTFFIEGMQVNQKLGYTYEEKRDQIFNEIKDEHIQELVDTTLKMFQE